MTLQMSKDHDSLSTVIKPCEFPLFDDVDYHMYPETTITNTSKGKEEKSLASH